MEREAAAPVAVDESDQSVPETPPPAPVPSPSTRRLPPAVWVTGLAVIVILILYFFTGH
jgi:hypothetical protein